MKLINSILNALAKLKCKFKSSCCSSECSTNNNHIESSSDWSPPMSLPELYSSSLS